MQEPYILVAPNGARRGKVDHPSLPVTTDQIVETAQSCSFVGAHGLHLHIRDENGRHTLDVGRYRETLSELALKIPTLQVQITTEAAGRFSVAEQLHCIEAVQPAWVSIAVREINRDPALAFRVYAACADINAKVQHILYDAHDLRLLDHWMANGVVHKDQSDRLFVLGRYEDGKIAEPFEVADALRSQDTMTGCMVCAFGPNEHDCLLRAIELGAAVRVGFENSLSNSMGEPWADNAASVSALIAKQKGKCHEPRISTSYAV